MRFLVILFLFLGCRSNEKSDFCIVDSVSRKYSSTLTDDITPMYSITTDSGFTFSSRIHYKMKDTVWLWKKKQ